MELNRSFVAKMRVHLYDYVVCKWVHKQGSNYYRKVTWEYSVTLVIFISFPPLKYTSSPDKKGVFWYVHMWTHSCRLRTV